MNLLKRAKEDAKERAREKRAAERERREEAKSEIAALAEQAAVMVSKKLETEVTADQLTHVEGLPPDDAIYYSMTLDDLTFEIVRKEGSAQFGLYLLTEGPDDLEDEIGPRRYIRRLADLIEGDS